MASPYNEIEALTSQQAQTTALTKENEESKAENQRLQGELKKAVAVREEKERKLKNLSDSWRAKELRERNHRLKKENEELSWENDELKTEIEYLNALLEKGVEEEGKEGVE